MNYFGLLYYFTLSGLFIVNTNGEKLVQAFAPSPMPQYYGLPVKPFFALALTFPMQQPSTYSLQLLHPASPCDNTLLHAAPYLRDSPLPHYISSYLFLNLLFFPLGILRYGCGFTYQMRRRRDSSSALLFGSSVLDAENYFFFYVWRIARKKNILFDIQMSQTFYICY